MPLIEGFELEGWGKRIRTGFLFIQSNCFILKIGFALFFDLLKKINSIN